MYEKDLKEALPSTWHKGGGCVSDTHYTQWFYSNLRFHYRGIVFWDDGNGHTVELFEETGLRNDGDVEVSSHPTYCETFESRNEALDAVAEKTREYSKIS